MKSMHGAFGKTLFSCTGRLTPALVLGLLAWALPAAAQTSGEATRPWYVFLWDLHTLPYVIGSAVFCYLFSVVLTMLLIRSGYPPNVARFSVWLGLLLWLALQVGVIFRYILLVAFPLWFYLILFLFIAAVGIILLATKRQSA